MKNFVMTLIFGLVFSVGFASADFEKPSYDDVKVEQSLDINKASLDLVNTAIVFSKQQTLNTINQKEISIHNNIEFDIKTHKIEKDKLAISSDKKNQFNRIYNCKIYSLNFYKIPLTKDFHYDFIKPPLV